MRKALQTALAHIRWQSFGECRTPGSEGALPTAAEAAAAIEDALKQKPVAWMDKDQEDLSWKNTTHFTVPLYKGTP